MKDYTPAYPSSEEFTRMFRKAFDKYSGPSCFNVSPDSLPKPTDDVEKESKPTALEELMALTGLDNIKEQISREISYQRIMKMRHNAGYRTPVRLMHMLMTGPPGTGKTTTARLIGSIYHQEGLLSKGHMIETCRADLIGTHIGDTENNTRRRIDAARSGILFIDEIYSLVDDPDDGRDFGQRVIDTLLPVMSDPSADIMVIGAGYKPNIKKMLKANSGLASRFPLVVEFENFSFEQLMDIAVKHLQKFGQSFSMEAYDRFSVLISQLSRTENFGNARTVITILENHCLPSMCQRLVAESHNSLFDIERTNIIEQDDIPALQAVLPLLEEKGKHVGFI